jgi:dTDP-4-amino-4,6-dideoxygalactose transaminase
VVFSGFTPVFCDVDPRTFVITPQEVERAFKRDPDIAVVLPVHLMGYPADMRAIGRIAARHGALVMEDAAQAHGTQIGTQRVGSFGALGAFSFYIAHNIQAGEMGALTTNDAKLFALLKKV